MSWDPVDQNDIDKEDDEMARLTDSYSADVESSVGRAEAQPTSLSLEGKLVCPFCGSINSRADEPCPSCGMENTPATRNSTRGRVGPWYVLQKRNPAAPGMKFETLVKFIRKGRIQPRAVLRGPTTSQLWRFAVTVKGVSREFGLCYNCGGDIDPAADQCPHCSRDQRPPVDPNALLEVSAPKPAAVRPQPIPAEARAHDDPDLSDTMMPAPVVMPKAAPKPAPQKQPEPVRQPVAAPVNKPLVRVPEISQEERDRREIEAGRHARENEPRDPNKSSPTLSARELATAFQLDFTPTDRKRRRNGKSHKGLYALLFLLLIGGAGTAAYFNVPAFKETVDTNYASASTKLHDWMASPAPAKPAPPSLEHLTLSNNPTMPGPQSPVHVTPPVNDTPTRNHTPPANNTQSPEVKAPPVPDKPAVVTPLVPVITLAEAYDLEHKLWGEALDSESRGDWAAAVAAYQKIKALPAKAQPSSLEMRLSAAKAKLGK